MSTDPAPHFPDAAPLPLPPRDDPALEVEDPTAERDPPPTRPEDLFQRRPDIRSIALVGLLILGICYTLYFARPVVFPIVLSILLAFVLDPVVGMLQRLHLPRALATAIVLLGLTGGTGYGVYRLSAPAAEWVEQAPEHLDRLELKLRNIKQPVEEMGRATKEVEKIARLRDENPPEEVRVREPTLGENLVAGAGDFLSDGVVTLVLLFFLLASGDLFLRKLARVLPRLSGKKVAVRVVRQMRSDISTYLLTLSAINVALGLAIAGALWALDMPSPVLWGVMGGLLNFVPYLGPLIGVTIVAAASLLTFDTVGRAALAPLAYLALNTLEGSFVTPAIMGRRLSLNPIAVFISLLFWGWLWGVPGALMAVPLVVTAKIICDQYEPLSGLGEFLGRA